MLYSFANIIYLIRTSMMIEWHMIYDKRDGFLKMIRFAVEAWIWICDSLDEVFQNQAVELKNNSSSKKWNYCFTFDRNEQNETKQSKANKRWKKT